MPLTKQTKPETIIKDFEKSDDPKFAGDSAEKRKQRALAAYYKLHPEKSKKMHEDIQSFLNHASNGDKESAQAAFQEIIMDKIASRMENLKMDIAQTAFGFGEARKFDDDDYDKDDKKKGEEVRKARRAKAQGKYQKPEIEESVNEARSTSRPDFDSENAFHKMMNAPYFQSNHYDYGVRSAEKKHAKGTYDRSKLDKMGENLSKLGAWRYNENHPSMPQNAEEHRQVGKHIATAIHKQVTGE